MANFVAIVDPDSARRQAFMQQVRARIALLPGLRPGTLELGPLAVAWAAGERAPVDVLYDAHTAAIVWGDAIAEAAPDAPGGATATRIDATRLAAAWAPRRAATPPPFDGFHAALRYDATDGLTVGGDLFGIFPLYHAHDAGVTIVASSPELIPLHPRFPPVLDPAGLIGMLLAYGTLGGLTLHRHVRRLQPGCALRATATGVVELNTFRIAASAPCGQASFDEQVERLHGAYAAAVERHAPSGSPLGILLSGGRDSRMLCGYLGARARSMPALTLGRGSDYEAGCARAVSRALHLRHAVAEPPHSELVANAALQARWEQLGTGFSNVHMWSALAPLQALPSRFLTGYLRESLDFTVPSPDFDTLFATHYNRGFTAAQLRRLLLPRWHSLLDERLAAMRSAYEGSADEVAERPWRFQLAHYARTHPGGVPWRLSFASWPVLPILDRALLNTIASVPLSTVAGRRAQDAILRQRFPSLARLPLDRNHHDTEPLLPGRLRHRLNPFIVAQRERRARHPRAGGDRRYYYRVYDIDGPGWRDVRRMAEPFRSRLADHFDMREVARVLPPPSADMHLSDVIHDAFRPKTLLGLMLWAEHHPL